MLQKQVPICNFFRVSYGDKFIHIHFMCNNMAANVIHKWGINTKYCLYRQVYVPVSFLKPLLCLKINNLVRDSLSSYLKLGQVRLISVHFMFCFLFVTFKIIRAKYCILQGHLQHTTYLLHSVITLLPAILESAYRPKQVMHENMKGRKMFNSHVIQYNLIIIEVDYVYNTMHATLQAEKCIPTIITSTHTHFK